MTHKVEEVSKASQDFLFLDSFVEKQEFPKARSTGSFLTDILMGPTFFYAV